MDAFFGYEYLGRGAGTLSELLIEDKTISKLGRLLLTPGFFTKYCQTLQTSFPAQIQSSCCHNLPPQRLNKQDPPSSISACQSSQAPLLCCPCSRACLPSTAEASPAAKQLTAEPQSIFTEMENAKGR